ncbi:DUF1900-domain-containing protein, partial [Anaeromyces robustus]
MAPSFVRSSKFRHVFGTGAKRPDNSYENIKVSGSAWDTNLVKVNPKYLSVNLKAGGGGSFAVIPLERTGKLQDNLPCFNGHSAPVLDTDFNPFNDNIIASSAEDCKVMIWNIPEEGLKENITTPVISLMGKYNHDRKVGHVLFHPVADNVLASASGDLTVRIWDITNGEEKVQLNGHSEIIQSLTWSYNGSLLCTSCRDKTIRVFDVRAGKIAMETSGHQGVKGSRAVWMGDLDKVATTGFSRTSDRQLFVYDTKNFSTPIVQENIDTSSGVLMPFYDNDTRMIYLAGKGDGNIRYYEFVDDNQQLYFLSEYKSSEPQRGMGFLPKRAVDTAEVEVARLYKLHSTAVEPISFRVPRKSDNFASDIYTDTCDGKPALTCEEFFSGKDANPILFSLKDGFVPIKREFSVDNAAAAASL